MQKFKFFPHTADVKFHAYGKTLEDAFSNSALAMFSVMVNVDKVEDIFKEKVKVKANDEKGLLYKFLEELLFLLDAKFFLLHRVKKLQIKKEGNSLTLNAELSGDRFKEKYELFGGVKAITYNQMEIKKRNNIWVIQAVVDV